MSAETQEVQVQASGIGSQPVAIVTEERRKEETEAAVEQSLEQKLIVDFTRHKDEISSQFGKRVGTRGAKHLRKLLNVAQQHHIVGPDLDALKALYKFVGESFNKASKASKLEQPYKQKNLVKVWTDLANYASEKLVGLQELMQNVDKAKSAYDQPDHADAQDIHESPVDAPPRKELQEQPLKKIRYQVRGLTPEPPEPSPASPKKRRKMKKSSPQKAPLSVIREEERAPQARVQALTAELSRIHSEFGVSRQIPERGESHEEEKKTQRCSSKADFSRHS